MKKNNTLIITLPLLLIVAVGVIYQYGYLGIKSGIESLYERENAKVKSLEKYANLIAEKPEIEKRIAVLKEMKKEVDTKLIEGKTPSLAAAALQDKVNGIIVGRGGLVTSGRVSKPEDLGAFRMISVSMDAAMPDMRALNDVLYMIETQTPYFILKELDIRVRDYRNPKELMVRFDVAALLRGK
ncbi:MAG: hypothetical protein HQL10_00695 [Nitrospirae bacterium]|nr:hypothetical protein [Nitrospirota bacterium]